MTQSWPEMCRFATLRNTMLRLVEAMLRPLSAIRKIFAENRLDAIALAKQGFL